MMIKRNGITLDITKLEIFAEKNGVAQDVERYEKINVLSASPR